jgi:hypothetical protein
MTHERLSSRNGDGSPSEEVVEIARLVLNRLQDQRSDDDRARSAVDKMAREILRLAYLSETGASMLFANGDCRAEVSSACKDAVFAKLMAFFNDHKCWSGESYCQNDSPQIDSMDLMSELLDDIIKAKVTYE